MINSVVDYLVSELNQYMVVRTGSDHDLAVASSVIKPDGQPESKAAERVAVSVVNIEADRVFHSTETIARRNSGSNEIVKPEIQVSLYLLFAGNFAQYTETLKAISLVAAFFQRRPAFEFGSIPGMENRQGRLVCEMFSATFEQVNHLWGAMGAKYLPSLIYKAGLVPITDEAVEGEAPAVLQISTSGVGL